MQCICLTKKQNKFILIIENLFLIVNEVNVGMARTKGSKNRSKEEIAKEREQKAMMPKRGRGRPRKDSVALELAVDQQETVKKKVGRPKGRKSSYTMSEKALAQRASTRAIQNPRTDEDIEYNARLITHIMQINEIAATADRHDILSLRSCFVAYLKLCQANGFNVSNLSAYAAMGMDYKTFFAFSKKEDPEIREFCQWVKKTCAMFRENMVANNKLNPVIGIFWQRNYDGLRNDTEQVQAAQEQEEDSYETNSSYKDKYRKLIGG